MSEVGMPGGSRAPFYRLWRGWKFGAILWAVVAAPAGARATVTEPPISGSSVGETVPKPSTAIEISVVTARGFSSAAATLPGLFASRGETIDYVKDAQTSPGTFSTECGLTGQLVMRGGGCALALGWYNATPEATTAPPSAEIYPIIPAAIPAPRPRPGAPKGRSAPGSSSRSSLVARGAGEIS